MRRDIVKMAKCCLAAYSQSKLDIADLKLDEAVPFKNSETSTEGFVGVDNEKLIVAYAGTMDIQDWMTNVDTKPTEVDLPGGYTVSVHTGFLQAYQSTAQEVQRLITEFNSKAIRKLMFTGHSLGGALAGIAGLHCVIVNKEYDSVVFGCPRWGGWCLASVMRKNMLRIEARGDLVPSLPVPWSFHRPAFLYKHCGAKIRRGYYVPGLTTPHSMERYLQLARLLQAEHDEL